MHVTYAELRIEYRGGVREYRDGWYWRIEGKDGTPYGGNGPYVRENEAQTAGEAEMKRQHAKGN